MRLDELPEMRGGRCDGEVEAWLRVLRRLLRVSGEQASNICEELEMHLRERIRDLEVSGVTEAEAIRIAIGELGDAAVLAERFHSAARWKIRRLSMNVAIAVVAGSAALLSLVAVSRTAPGGGAAAEPGMTVPEHAVSAKPLSGVEAALLDLQGGPGEKSLQQKMEGNVPLLARLPQQRPPAKFTDPWGQEIDLWVPATPETTLGALLETIGTELELRVHVRWKRLEQLGVSPDQPVLLTGGDLELPEVFKRINESLEQDVRLDFRAADGVLEVADREFFDRRELTLVTYDIGPLLEAGHERFDQDRKEVVAELLGTLQQFVSQNDWVNNGGDLASHTLLGDRLFIQAPPRMHRQIEWILAQLPREPQAAAPTAGRMVRVYPLKHVAAEEMLTLLRRVAGNDHLQLVADLRTNSIVAAGSVEAQGRIVESVATLDRPSPGASR